MSDDKADILKELAATDPELVNSILESFTKLPAKQKATVFKKIFKTPLPNTQTFYKEKYALNLVQDIRAMMESDFVLEYPQSDYPKWRLHTLYLYITQAFNYLCEFMDDEQGTFKAFRETVEVCERKAENKVVIKLKVDPTNYVLKARRVSAEEYSKQSTNDESINPTWKTEMMQYLETAKVGDLFEKDINLSEVEALDLTAMFENDEAFALIIKPERKGFMLRKVQ
jgi:hypothetical protein